MEMLAHRGLCFNKEERNTLPALFKALDEGFGLETDVRDLDGQLMIAHDMPRMQTAIPLEQLLRFYRDHQYTSTLGINIKADGLQERLLQQLRDHDIVHYFVFDMSVPDTLGYLKLGMTTFVRRSDIEYHPELAARCQGVWLDELMGTWIDAAVIVEQAATTRALAIVSPELHGRTYTAQWAEIERALALGCSASKLLLCTDFPREAAAALCVTA